MSAKLELRWLKEDAYQGTAQRFIRFCKKDIVEQAESDQEFDFEVYDDAIREVLERIEAVEMQKKQGVKPC